MTSVHVENVPYHATEQDIAMLFSNVGTVIGARILFDPETGRPKGFAIVDFEDEAQAQRAVGELNGADLQGNQLRVNLAN